MKKAILMITVLSLVILSGVFCGCTKSGDAVQTENVSGQEVTDVVTSDEPVSEPTQGPGALVALKQSIESELQKYEGEWAVYVEDLKTGDKFEINNKKMVSASLIKLFIMGKVFEDIASGTIQKESVSADLESMITISDNEASNRLVAHVGGGEYTDMKSDVFQEGLKKVNAFAQFVECYDTEQQRDMKNSRPNPIPEENYTSVADCGKFLSRMYHTCLVSVDGDPAMLELLKKQTRTGKIPAGLPPGTVSANKTGELSNVENDAAIVFSPATDYVICVMSNAVPDTSVARANITYLSQMVYNFFNGS